jgi:hypothetical protein
MRATLASKLGILAGIGIALPTLFACIEHPLKPVEYDKAQEDEKQIQLTVNKDVDILFIIDNSGSMGEEQGNLAQNFAPFINTLEQDEVQANYRLGITTTDNGNPWCGATTTPEAGALVLSSCQGRLTHFTFTGTNPPTVVEDIACTDVCPYGSAELDDLMKETATDLDPNPKRRPWLQNLEGQTNLPDGVTAVEAFQCFGPQGIDGCGFESHMESMYKSLQRTKDSTEGSYGFLRENAILAIVVVTDEVDCSYRNEFKEIFETSGNRVFWTDPDAPYPTSAVCWNAGVDCVGSGTYDSCSPQDKDVNGNDTTDSSKAVLHPLQRYVDLVQGFENEKKMLNPDQEVIVAVIGGVPDGYWQDQGDIVYADSADQQFMDDFGIGPGCSSVYVHPHTMENINQTAVPPVRMREWAESFGDRNLYSICTDDYTPALTEIANRIASQIRPACYKECVKDTDPASDGLQPDCFVEEEVPGQPERQVPTCKLVGGTYEQPSADDNVCFYTLSDQSQSGDPNDDMSDECIEDGFNLEFKVLRREGFPAAGGTSLTATCQLSETPTVDCPNLGG